MVILSEKYQEEATEISARLVGSCLGMIDTQCEIATHLIHINQSVTVEENPFSYTIYKNIYFFNCFLIFFN